MKTVIIMFALLLGALVAVLVCSKTGDFQAGIWAGFAAAGIILLVFFAVIGRGKE